jgi:hypothetical protein
MIQTHFRTTVDGLGEIEVDVTLIPGEAPVFLGESPDPGSPDEYEIGDVRLLGVQTSQGGPTLIDPCEIGIRLRRGWCSLLDHLTEIAPELVVDDVWKSQRRGERMGRGERS